MEEKTFPICGVVDIKGCVSDQNVYSVNKKKHLIKANNKMELIV